jgi:hypothetical protein
MCWIMLLFCFDLCLVEGGREGGMARRVRTYVADDAEADGDFVLAVFGEDGSHDLNWLLVNAGWCH